MLKRDFDSRQSERLFLRKKRADSKESLTFLRKYNLLSALKEKEGKRCGIGVYQSAETTEGITMQKDFYLKKCLF